MASLNLKDGGVEGNYSICSPPPCLFRARIRGLVLTDVVVMDMVAVIKSCAMGIIPKYDILILGLASMVKSRCVEDLIK